MSEQLTLGEFIKLLEELPGDCQLNYDWCWCIPTTFHSYRGYYDQLALGIGAPDYDKGVKASVLLELCKAEIGRTHIGWKGGSEGGSVHSIWGGRKARTGFAISLR